MRDEANQDNLEAAQLFQEQQSKSPDLGPQAPPTAEPKTLAKAKKGTK